MSRNFFFKSLQFTNYRGLDGLHIKNLRRVNLISGFNGVGKSSLLEAIFFLLDRRGPIALTRPYTWRKIGLGGPRSLDSYFTNLDRARSIKITANTAVGKLDVTMRYGAAPVGVAINVPGGVQFKAEQQQSLSVEDGLHVESSIDSVPDDALFAIPVQDGLTVNSYRVGRSKIPQGIIVTPSTRNAPNEDASRFSSLIQEGKLTELIKLLSLIDKNIVGAQILHVANSPVIHASFPDGVLRPFPLLGEGVQTLLSIFMAIMSAPGGVVLLDEFESAIHYSVLPMVWARIAEVSNAYNCQIFAVTHSRECIAAALEGVKKGSRIEDFQYVRLERSSNGLVGVVYDGAEMGESLTAGWEVR